MENIYDPYKTDPDLMDHWSEKEYLSAYAESERYVISKNWRGRYESFIALSNAATFYWNTEGHSSYSSFAECIEFLPDYVEE